MSCRSSLRAARCDQPERCCIEPFPCRDPWAVGPAGRPCLRGIDILSEHVHDHQTMTDFSSASPVSATRAHLVLYDGVCELCNRLLQFLLKTIIARSSALRRCRARQEKRWWRGGVVTPRPELVLRGSYLVRRTLGSSRKAMPFCRSRQPRVALETGARGWSLTEGAPRSPV